MILRGRAARSCGAPPRILVSVDVQHGSGLSPWAPKPDPERERREQRTPMWLLGVRYGVPALMVLAGVVVAFAASDRDTGLEIGAMFVGAAIAVFLLNFFFRMGVEGDSERDREEEARAYFDQHGHWPGEGPRGSA